MTTTATSPPSPPTRLRPHRITAEDLAWWVAIAPTLRWHNARTYEDTSPHSYVAKDSGQLSPTDFDRAVRVIRTYGVPGKFWSVERIYHRITPHRYWTCRGPVEIQGVINRCDDALVYGEQDLPDTTPPPSAPPPPIARLYDEVSTDYDGRYTTAEDRAENAAVRSLVTRHFGAYAPSTLDIGCGTGLVLDLGITSPAIYTGVDPSQGMLNELVLKHPKIRPGHLFPVTAEEWLNPARRPAPTSPARRYELVTALFGAASYLDPETIPALADLASGLVLLMHYRPGYLPDYYDDAALAEEAHARSAVSLAAALALPGARSTELNNFVVTTR